MSIFLGSDQIGSINLVQLQLQNIDTNLEDTFINRTISSYTNNETLSIQNYNFYNCTNLTEINFPKCERIGIYAFYNCSNLTSVSFPKCTSIGDNTFCYCTNLTKIDFLDCTSIGMSAFRSCYNLISVNFPNCISIESYAFQSCTNLTSISFPNCSYIGNTAFQSCHSLTTISFPKCISIGEYAFRNCFNLLSLYLMGSSIPKLVSTTAFLSTPISNYTTSTGGIYGSIYVPASLYNDYLTATNWSVYSARIVSV